MRRAFPIALALAATLLLGCLEDRAQVDDAAVTPVDTGPNEDTSGPADPDVGAPVDTGPGLDVAATTGLANGEPCLVPADCSSGRCQATCEEGRFCIPATCQYDADCGAPVGTSSAACCVDGACVVTPGGACGDRTGEAGASCQGGGDTDCGAELACMGACLPTAFCASACTADTDCGDGWRCYGVAGGGHRCLPDPDLEGACTLDADCAVGGYCGLFLTFAGDGIATKCAAADAGGKGAQCATDQQCNVGVCWKGAGQSGVCAATCAEDLDCACSGGACKSDQICLPVVFGLGSGVFGATPLCWDGQRCTTAAECVAAYGQGAECAPSWRLTSVDEVCMAWPKGPGKATGAPCEQSTDCKSYRCVDGQCYDPVAAGGYCGGCTPQEGWCDALCISGSCIDSQCASVCADDADCAEYPKQSVCVGWGFAVQDGVDHSSVCVTGKRCESQTDCPGSELCQGIDEGSGWATVCRPMPAVMGGVPAGQACTTDGECASTRCDAGECKLRLGLGETCARGVDCETSLCASGQCAAPCAQSEQCAGGGSCVLSNVPTASNTQATLQVCTPAG